MYCNTLEIYICCLISYIFCNCMLFSTFFQHLSIQQFVKLFETGGGKYLLDKKKNEEENVLFN